MNTYCQDNIRLYIILASTISGCTSDHAVMNYQIVYYIYQAWQYQVVYHTCQDNIRLYIILASTISGCTSDHAVMTISGCILYLPRHYHIVCYTSNDNIRLYITPVTYHSCHICLGMFSQYILTVYIFYHKFPWQFLVHKVLGDVKERNMSDMLWREAIINTRHCRAWWADRFSWSCSHTSNAVPEETKLWKTFIFTKLKWLSDYVHLVDLLWKSLFFLLPVSVSTDMKRRDNESPCTEIFCQTTLDDLLPDHNYTDVWPEMT